ERAEWRFSLTSISHPSLMTWNFVSPSVPSRSLDRRLLSSLACGELAENIDRSVRTKLRDCGRVFPRLGNIEPVAVDKIAGRVDSAHNVVGGYMLAARLCAEAGEHHDF